MNIAALALGWSLSLGVMPQNLDVVQNGKTYTKYDRPCLYQTLGFNATLFDVVRFDTEVQTYDEPSQISMNFLPFRADYRIGISVTLGQITVGARHECDHPISHSNESLVKGYKNTKTAMYITIASDSE